MREISINAFSETIRKIESAISSDDKVSLQSVQSVKNADDSRIWKGDMVEAQITVRVFLPDDKEKS